MSVEEVLRARFVETGRGLAARGADADELADAMIALGDWAIEVDTGLTEDDLGGLLDALEDAYRTGDGS